MAKKYDKVKATAEKLGYLMILLEDGTALNPYNNQVISKSDPKSRFSAVQKVIDHLGGVNVLKVLEVQ